LVFLLQNANVAYLEKNPVNQICCISGRLIVPFNPDQWSSTVPTLQNWYYYYYYCYYFYNKYISDDCFGCEKIL